MQLFAYLFFIAFKIDNLEALIFQPLQWNTINHFIGQVIGLLTNGGAAVISSLCTVSLFLLYLWIRGIKIQAYQRNLWLHFHIMSGEF